MIQVHGRSREQRYTKLADWDYIEKCAIAAQPVPVFGNGDILSFDDYHRAKEIYSTVQGITIGRGALIKPWIFTEIKEKKLIDISSTERFDILRKYANYGLEHWGSDTRGVETTRRFMLEWISFLHRQVRFEKNNFSRLLKHYIILQYAFTLRHLVDIFLLGFWRDHRSESTRDHRSTEVAMIWRR